MSPEARPRFGHEGDVLWWIAQPEEVMHRASYTLPIGDRRFVVEPVDCPGLDEELAAAGGVDGVVVLMDRHSRDARAVATRHGVPVFVPDGARRIASAVGGPVAPLEPELDEGTVVVPLVSRRWWEEAALWRPADGILCVPESLGTSAHFTTADERIGVHPLVRLVPPRRALAGIDPDRLFVGHGHPVSGLRTGELEACLAAARRRLPRAWLTAARAWLP